MALQSNIPGRKQLTNKIWQQEQLQTNLVKKAGEEDVPPTNLTVLGMIWVKIIENHIMVVGENVLNQGLAHSIPIIKQKEIHTDPLCGNKRKIRSFRTNFKK